PPSTAPSPRSSPSTSASSARAPAPASSWPPPTTTSPTTSPPTSTCAASATVTPSVCGTTAEKKTRQLRRRVLAVRGFPIRLAVFRWVALPQPPARLRQARRAALARPHPGRRLHLRHAGGGAEPALALLRAEQPAWRRAPGGAQRAVVAPGAGGAAPDLPR